MAADIYSSQSEVEKLAVELRQCQADKDFIWNLWKRLQVVKPDVTEAVASVVRRQNEINEIKNRKILSVLKVKDDRLSDLENTVSQQAEELSNLVQIKTDLEFSVSKKSDDNADLKNKVVKLELELKNASYGDKARNEWNKNTMDRLDSEKIDMQHQLSAALNNLEVEKLKTSNEMDLRLSLQRKFSSLEKSLSKKNNNIQEISKELRDSRKQIYEMEGITMKLKSDLDSRNHELKDVQQELNDFRHNYSHLQEHTTQQDKLIQQQYTLHNNLQLDLKNKDETYKKELAALEKINSELNRRYDEAQQNENELMNKIDKLERKSLQRSTNSYFKNQSEDPVNDFHWSIFESANHSTPVHETKSQCRVRSPISPIHPEGSFGARSKRSKSCCDARKKWTAHVRSKSLGNRRLKDGTGGTVVSHDKNIQRLTKMLAETRALLDEKSDAMDILKLAHNHRLDRLKELQKSYNLIRRQLKTYEDPEPPRALIRKKKLPRASSKELRHERSDGVWNELSHVKRELAQLTTEKLNVDEELDVLRVQTSQDKALIYELDHALEHSKQELIDHLKSCEINNQKAAFKTILSDLKHENRMLLTAIDQQKSDIQSLTSDIITLENDKRSKEVENTRLNHNNHQLRMKISDLNTFNKQLQRQIEEGARLLEHKDLYIDQSSDIPLSVVREIYSQMSKNIINPSSEEDFTNNSMSNINTNNGKYVAKRKLKKSKGFPVRNFKVGRCKRKARIFKKHSNKSTVIMKDCGVMTDGGVTCSCQKPDNTFKVIGRAGAGKLPATFYQRQIRLLKHRIDGLHKQLHIVRERKTALYKDNLSLKNAVCKLNNEITSLNQKLQSNKTRLSGEVETLKTQNKQLESQLIEQKENQKSTEVNNLDLQKTTLELNLKEMSLKLKGNSMELNKQIDAVRLAKIENESLSKQLKIANDNVNRLERDLTQKRTLLEDQKNRLKSSQQTNINDGNTISEMTTRLQLNTEQVSRQKTQIESLKQQLLVFSKEKRQYEEKANTLVDELESKVKKISDYEQKVSNLELSVVDVEKTAKEQMHSLVEETEKAIQSLKLQLKKSEIKLFNHEQFLMALISEVIRRVHKTRLLIQQMCFERREANESLIKAENMAKDILDISQSELNEIMSVSSESTLQNMEQKQMQDIKWSKKCEKLIHKEDFAPSLVKLIMVKWDECYENILDCANYRTP